VADASLTHGVWLERVPELLLECADEWELELGEAYPVGAAGYVVRATLPDRAPAVVKLIYPHHESDHEAEALRVWEGDGAVRLLDHDEGRSAMLLERCEPGALLARENQDDALDVFIGLLPRLWKPAAEPFRPLADEAQMWIEHLPDEWEEAGRLFEKSVLATAIEALQALSSTQGEQVLLHQDLHADNVLSAQREPWLAIDPKPLVGEREFAVAPIVRDSELGHSKRDVLHRLDRLTSELGLDRERSRLWTIGQTVAWGLDTSYTPKHVETVSWLL
jgi:streptomycin 6-kinase